MPRINAKKLVAPAKAKPHYHDHLSMALTPPWKVLPLLRQQVRANHLQGPYRRFRQHIHDSQARTSTNQVLDMALDRNAAQSFSDREYQV